jgi:hypothetical protein
LPPFKTGSRPGEKKAEAYIAGDYLADALREFSGYIAADELYDGPFCVLSIVDNRTFRRLIYEVLDDDPTQEDILRFFKRFKHNLDLRGLKLHGISTDASGLYPGPVTEVFGSVAHQVCEFHTIAELTKAVLKALSKVRRELKARMPQLPRGRPGTQRRRQTRLKQRVQTMVANLFEHRYLFVKHRLSTKEKRTLNSISRGQPHLRPLRPIMDEVYRLFDRRCRTESALQKLAKLRQRVQRFKTISKTLKKLFSPNLEKALTFLDDSLLPSTSNAVERGNRRYRKMQKTVYRVRAQAQVQGRIALDMQRDAQAERRDQTVETLHCARLALS